MSRQITLADKYVAVATAVAVGVLSFLAGPQVLAHHSFAMFDHDKSVTLVGTVKDFQWTNPHVWIQVIVVDPETETEVEWSIEGGSPNGLSRQGWKRTSIKPGDNIQVVMHPLKNGQAGGSLVRIFVDGIKVGD